jgi:cold shock CspA family protein
MYQGRIRHIKLDAGYGFISPDGGADGDLFFHVKQILSTSTPRVDQRVSFDIGVSKDGRSRAERVRLL